MKKVLFEKNLRKTEEIIVNFRGTGGKKEKLLMERAKKPSYEKY